MKSQKLLEKEIYEKDQALKYLKQKYEEDTGRKLKVPQNWDSFLSNFLNEF